MRISHLEVFMRLTACLSVISLLAMPAYAMAQDASAPPPPDQPGMQPPPPPDQPGDQPPPYQPGMQPPPPGAPDASRPHDHDARMMQTWQQRFDAANTTHDGHLTLAQAQAAGMKPVVKHFGAIDIQNRGYVTLNEIMAWHLDQEAQKMERRAAQLRAQD